jgi:hypothetical protein
VIAAVTVLFAFPLGYLVHQRLAAYVTYLALYLYSFTFQTAYLTRAWVAGDPAAGFSRPPDLSLDYLAVTLAVAAVGCALVWLGHGVGARRRARRGAADLDPAPRP